MMNRPRLIESAFPLKQASLDSVREKYGPKGHISGFYLWPARRPLAASPAVLITTLLPGPENADERKRIIDALAGKVVETTGARRCRMGGRRRWHQPVEDHWWIALDRRLDGRLSTSSS